MNSLLSKDHWTRVRSVVLLSCLVVPIGNGADVGATPGQEPASHLRQAKIFLAAGDYRHAIEACQREVVEHPSAESYLFLTYVYHALDAYLDHLAKVEKWVAVEQLYLNLASGRVEDLIDPPDVLARIAKEIIQGAAQKQSDMTAAMAARLDDKAVAYRWKQQAEWRKTHPEDWWFKPPDAWGW
jgi:hypothetical protein